MNVIKQLLGMIGVIWVVVTAVFWLLHLAPGDPVAVMLGDTLGMDEDSLRQDLGLHTSIWTQYFQFLWGIVSGNWGVSFYYKEPIVTLLWQRLPATLWLTALAMSFAMAIALPLGIIAAIYHRQWQDQTALLIALLGMSIPNFVLGPILIILLAVDYGWFPVSGMQAPWSWFLPALTLGTALSAILTRMLRASLLEVLHEDYIRTAAAKGCSAHRVLFFHALRNAFLPVLTLLGLQVGALLGGAVITETVFDWPGLGLLLVESIQRRDYPLVLGCILLVTIFYVTVNTLLEILYVKLDPRIAQRSHR